MTSVAPLTVAVPMAGAAGVLFLKSTRARPWLHMLTLVTVIAQIGLSVALLSDVRSGTIVYWFGGWSPRPGVVLGVSFTVDAFGAAAAVLSGVVVLAGVAVARSTMREAGALVDVLLLTLAAAMTGLCLSGDLFNMFVFYELTTVAAIGLAAHDTHSRGALRAALNLAVSNSIGAVLFLIGLALLYGRTGALNLAEIGRRLTGLGRVDRLTIVALSLLLVGCLVKAAVVPFHFWIVDTVGSGPVPLAIILGGALGALGVFAFARIYWTVFAGPLQGEVQVVQTVLTATGASTGIVGGALAVTFPEPRRRLAAVGVSCTGILLVGVGCLSARGLAGVAITAVSNGTVLAAVFIGIGLLTGEGFGRRAGRFIVGVGGLALAGLPVFGAALGDATIACAASAAGSGWAVPAVVAAAALSAAAVLEMAWAAPSGPTLGTGTGSVGVAAILLGLAVGASTLGRSATVGAAHFVDTVGYQGRVLDGTSLPGVVASRMVSPAFEITFGLVSVGAAAVVAAGLVRGVRPKRLGLTLRRWHASTIGDAALWITVGTASLTVALAVGLR